MKSGLLFLIFHFFFMNVWSQPASSRIDSLMTSSFPSSMPGAVIAIQQNQKTIFKKSYGLADLRSRTTGYGG